MVTFRGLVPPYKTWPYLWRFFTIVVAGTFLNLAGLGSTQLIGWSLLFFDMAGTAFASLLGGAVAGLLVALLTGAVGSFFLGPQYYVFNVVNIAGAFMWAILPRLGLSSLGGDMFDPRFYRRGLLNVLLVGLVVGIGCTIVAFLVHAHVLNLLVVPGAEANSMMSAGTLTSRNNVEMIQSISAMLHKLRLNNDAIIFISTFITNVPDKIIATATAVVLIFLFGTLPNYKTQKRIIRSNHDVVNSKFIDNRVLLFTVCSIPMLTSPVVTWKITHNITSVGIIAAICFFALTCSMIEHSYLRSLDREIRPDEDFTEDNKIFFSIPESYSLRFQREIFEDILKLAVIVVSGLSFIVASFAPNSAYCDSEHLDSLVGCGMLYRLAVINILILTGYRYVLVVIMRLIGRI